MNSNNLRYWEVGKDFLGGGNLLIHKHPFLKSEGTICHFENDKWFCPYCGESPPENIVFVAKLSFCERREPYKYKGKSVYSNIPTSYLQASRKLKNRGRLKLGYETWLYPGVDNSIEIVYFGTVIVSFYPNESAKITPGRWKTTTTKQRICTALSQSGWQIASDRGEWWWWRINESWQKFCEFENGDRVYLNPDLPGKDGIY